MAIFTRLRQGIRLLRGRDRLESDLQKEVSFHLRMEIDQRMAQGLTPAEARRTALRDFGGVDRSAEEVRDVRGVTFWDSLTQDIRFGLRSLRRTPGYTLAAIVTLGLGIGANTAIFGVVNGVLLHPLPYQDSGQLVRIDHDRPLVHQTNIGVAIPEVWDYRNQLKTIGAVVEYHQMSFVLLDKGQADRVATGVVSSTYFDVFGIKPLFGRAFRESDDVLDAEPVLVLSNAFWLRHFGGDEHVVGRRVELNDRIHTVVGVLPPIPGYPQENDVYMPTSACPFRAEAQTEISKDRRAFPSLAVFGRLKPGVSEEQATAEVRAVSAAFAEHWPQVYQRAQTGFSGTVNMLESEITHDARPIVWALLATTGLVLLIACANVANLSLARTFSRARELALRTALGAGRGRLVRQLLTENTIVALAGGVLGVLLARTTSGMLAAFAHLFTPRAVDASIDGTVLIFALVLSVLTGLGFGVIPAMTARRSLVGALKEGGAQAGDGARGMRLRSGLVVAQVAVGFALVTAAGLLLHSLYELSTIDLGFQHADQVLAAEAYGNFTHQKDNASTLRFYGSVLERAQAIPGVTAAAVTNAVPQSRFGPGAAGLRIEGEGAVDPAKLPQVDPNIATEDYFRLLDIPILAGRTFTTTDTAESKPVAIINQSMAALWGKRNPIGTSFSVDGVNKDARLPLTVVGIVGDVRQYDVNRAPLAAFYIPLHQFAGRRAPLQVMIRTAGDPVALAGALRAAVREVDPDVPVENVHTLAAMREGQLRTPRLGAALLAIFACFALLITLAGLAAVIATTVSQRTREIGVRMALGAGHREVLAMVLAQGAWMVGTGLAVGVGAAILFGHSIAAYLYLTPVVNPFVYLVVGALFVLAGLIACLGPARRATSIDPLIALRAE